MSTLDRQLVELCRLLQRRSIILGEVTLASGAKSSYYCDTKKTMLSPDGALLVGEIFYRFAREAGAEAIGGLALGSTFIAAAVAAASARDGHPVYGYTVRDRRKDHGLREETEESYHPDGRPLLCAGRKVAVVDDVVTRGGSILKAIRAVQERGCEIVAVIPMVDRREGGGDRLREKKLPYYPLFVSDGQGNLSVYDPAEPSRHPRVAAAGGASP